MTFTPSPELAFPLIDITALRDGSDPTTVARELRCASQSLGFIYIHGHGIAQTTIDAARREAMAFFGAPESAKAEVRVSAQHRGWLAQGGARMQSDVAADRKESFIWALDGTVEQPIDAHSLRGPNRWPAFQPALEPAAMRWFEQAHQVAHHLMRGFARGLGLPDIFFLRSCDRPLSRASSVWYPPAQSATDDRFGVAAHTDFGVLTVLCQDAVGGLEVQTAAGHWQAAPPIEGTLVVNVGDLLSRWTAGRYRSTPHRVRNSSDQERLSLVLAYDPNPETLIDAREVTGDSPCKPITCGDYLDWRFAQAFSHRQAGQPVT